METDDDDDLINSGDESDMDSEVEDRVDGVKSLLSKSKGSAKTLSDEGPQKTTRPPLYRPHSVQHDEDNTGPENDTTQPESSILRDNNGDGQPSESSA